MTKLNKTDVIDILAQRTGISENKTETVLDGLFGLVYETLKKGGVVNLSGFGQFYVSKRKARTGKHPSTLKVIKIPAQLSARFKAGSNLKAAAKKKRK